MSFGPTAFRPFARNGMGGKAAGHFRGPSARGPSARGQIGTVVYRSPGGIANRALTGITYDSTNVVLGLCRVELFQTGGDMTTRETTSDAAGNYSFSNPGSGPFYVVAYKAGSPDVAGTSVNTLIAV